ncbi:hypothetical protein [Rhizobium leguminosarum]|uniref:hypothetical protein n=1 Tax=Rhizobium leguminosarum TaxID=384 RepID=UPI002E11C79B|nr:hypothetical protein U8Q02_36780 [Rhizobium leguminosarum]
MYRTSVLILLIASLASPAAGSDAAVLGGPAIGLGGAILGKRALKTCAKHAIMCSMAAVGGAVIIGGKLIERKNRAQVDEPEGCKGGYTDLYRVVGRKELDSTLAKQEYYLQDGGYFMTQKQFWFSIKDANWFMQSETFGNGGYVITSKACAETLELGELFPDVGHPAISFKKTALRKLSHDARRTGGIISLGAF